MVATVDDDTSCSMENEQHNHQLDQQLQQQGQQQQQPTSMTSYRPSHTAPLMKLSVDLINTYKHINQVVNIALFFLHF